MDLTSGLAIYGAGLATLTSTPAILGFLRSRKPAVSWEITGIKHGMFALRNAGRKTAHEVQAVDDGRGVIVTAGLVAPIDIAGGASQTFTVVPPSAHDLAGWDLELTWRGQRKPVLVHLPPDMPPDPPRFSRSWS